MMRATATFSRANTPDAVGFVQANANRRPVMRRAVVTGLATLITAAIIAGAATASAAWILAVALGTLSKQIAFESGAPTDPHGLLAEARNLPRLAANAREFAALASALHAFARKVTNASDEIARKLAPSPFAFAGENAAHPTAPASWGELKGLARGEEPITLAALAFSPTSISQLPPDRAFQQTNDVPPPAIGTPQTKGWDNIAGRTPAPPPKSAAAAPLSSPILFNMLQKRVSPRQAHNDLISPPDIDGHTAIYDIEAHTVYLPNGLRLEAHSGLGRRLDDPRHVNEKNRGATPPNVYELVLRGQLFHGVRAIRLNPIEDGKMFGRDGILAHPYMLGRTGQSFGCVSFRDYPEFLKAFLTGEIDRLVVVPHLAVKT